MASSQTCFLPLLDSHSRSFNFSQATEICYTAVKSVISGNATLKAVCLNKAAFKYNT